MLDTDPDEMNADPQPWVKYQKNPVLGIRDVYPGSEIFLSGSAAKNLSILTTKKFF
jgi:hypothetical protein